MPPPTGAHLATTGTASAVPTAEAATPSGPDRAESAPVHPGQGFRPDIQGLRAVAVGLVVAAHAGLPFVDGGYVGVDVFFVISGFLITTQLTGELTRRGRISLSRFYARRVLRLLPLSSLVIAVTLAAAWLWLPPLRARDISLDALASALYTVNIRLADQGTDYLRSLDEPSPFQHYWSLAVEEQFYLVWPLLLLLASFAVVRRRTAPDGSGAPGASGDPDGAAEKTRPGRFGRVWRSGRPGLPGRSGRSSMVSAAVVLAVVTAGSLALSVVQTASGSPWAYFGLPTRAWELGAGALVALAAARLARLPGWVAAPLTWLGLGAVVAAGLLYSEATPFPGYAAVLPVAGAAAIIAAGCARPAGGAELLLRIWPAQQIGRVSYGWYLWHWPFLMIGPYAFDHDPTRKLRTALALAALVVALVSLWLVEDPLRTHRALRARARRALGFGAALTAATAALALISALAPNSLVGSGVAPRVEALTAAQLAPYVQRGVDNETVPVNLTPSLEGASHDHPDTPSTCIAHYDETDPAVALAAGCGDFGAPSGAERPANGAPAEGEPAGEAPDRAAPAIPTVVLFGDSHAHQWFGALDAIARLRQWRLVVLTKQACPAADAPVLRNNEPYAACHTWRERAFRTIDALRPDHVVVASLIGGGSPLGTTGDPDAVWARAWGATFSRLRATGAAVTLLHDTPFPGTDVPTCLSARLFAADRCNLPRSAVAHPARRVAISRAATRAGAAVIEPTTWFCAARNCPVIIGNVLVYRDASHISDQYARVLTPLLDQELGRALRRPR